MGGVAHQLEENTRPSSSCRQASDFTNNLPCCQFLDDRRDRLQNEVGLLSDLGLTRDAQFSERMYDDLRVVLRQAPNSVVASATTMRHLEVGHPSPLAKLVRCPSPPIPPARTSMGPADKGALVIGRAHPGLHAHPRARMPPEGPP